jgi:hypothetical protein
MSATVSAEQRHTPACPCKVCGGYHSLPSGRGERCYGFLSSDGRYCHCSREEYANGLPQEASGTYAHRLDGPCKCGQTHGTAPFTTNGNGHAANSSSEQQYPNGKAAAPQEPKTAEALRPAGYREVRAYEWLDETGVVQYETVRYEHLCETQDKKPSKPKKTFSFRRPGPGRPGWYVSGKGDVPPVVFRKDRLAANPDEDLHVAEGEDHALALEALGFLATTTAGGAGMVKSYPSEELRSAARGRHVVIHADADDDGEQYARTIADAVLPVAKSVRIVRYGDFGPGGDVLDTIRAGATREDIERRVAGGTATLRSAGAEDSPSGSARVRFITAREFAQQTPAETPWVIEPFVPLGGITKIDGAPKKAGKTTLITHMVTAVLTGSNFLGKPTKQGPVVLLTEQGSTSFRESLARAGLLERDDLYIATYRDFAGVDWPQVVGDASALAGDVGAVLLVIDTIPACAGVRGDDENSAGRALEVMAPIQMGADTYNLGVVGSFHDKKGGGEVGESGRGSSAYAGAVDVILQVTRPGGNFSATIRKIEALSRFEATPTELYIDLTDAGYISLGSEDDVVSAALARALIEVLPDTEEAAKRIDSVTDKETEEVIERGLIEELASQGIKVARSTLDAELKRWLKERYAGQSGTGKRGSPHRYWLTATPPDAFFRSIGLDPSEERNDPPGARIPLDRETVSSDAHAPSEESNGAPEGDGAAQPILSSDAPVAYSGRNESAPLAGIAQEWV